MNIKEIIIVILLISIVVVSYVIENSNGKMINARNEIIENQNVTISKFKENVSKLVDEYDNEIDTLSDIMVVKDETIAELEKQLIQSEYERELLIKKLLEVSNGKS